MVRKPAEAAQAPAEQPATAQSEQVAEAAAEQADAGDEAQDKAEGADTADVADAAAVEAAQAPAGEGEEGAAEAEPVPLPDGPIAMIHPDGGTCDEFERDDKGVHLVPQDRLADAISHGFEPYAGETA